jgi:LmbE family N-acetylglucosaminyl deacetylase
MDLTIPDKTDRSTALARTTHLGIGAHQDDLEFMAAHGILECFQKADAWFGGITCTDGAGSARSGPYAVFSDEQMKAVRLKEQHKAAAIGEYAFMAQLGHPSSDIKDSEKRAALVATLAQLIDESRPEVIYTHNPVDKHATHVGVVIAVIDAIRSLPEKARPRRLLGCEVWRDLDWLPDSRKVVLDVSDHPNLVAALNGVFDSQITGGKRYDRAVLGRRQANATFLESHAVDAATEVTFALDLSTLIHGREVALADFIKSLVDEFREEAASLVANLTAQS